MCILLCDKKIQNRYTVVSFMLIKQAFRIIAPKSLLKGHDGSEEGSATFFLAPGNCIPMEDISTSPDWVAWRHWSLDEKIGQYSLPRQNEPSNHYKPS